jgi:hypothetical protein
MVAVTFLVNATWSRYAFSPLLVLNRSRFFDCRTSLTDESSALDAPKQEELAQYTSGRYYIPGRISNVVKQTCRGIRRIGTPQRCPKKCARTRCPKCGSSDCDIRVPFRKSRLISSAASLITIRSSTLKNSKPLP